MYIYVYIYLYIYVCMLYMYYVCIGKKETRHTKINKQ